MYDIDEESVNCVCTKSLTGVVFCRCHEISQVTAPPLVGFLPEDIPLSLFYSGHDHQKIPLVFGPPNSLSLNDTVPKSPLCDLEFHSRLGSRGSNLSDPFPNMVRREGRRPARNRKSSY